MKFKLTTSGSFYNEEDAKKLAGLGLPLEKNNDGPCATRFEYWLKPSEPTVEIEIETLDALMEFVKEWGDIVLSEDTIEIYDDYRE